MKKQGPRGPASILLRGVEYVTLTELAKRTNRHICHLSKLIKEGRLPAGWVAGKIRYVPYKSAMVDLLMSPAKRPPGGGGVAFLSAMEI